MRRPMSLVAAVFFLFGTASICLAQSPLLSSEHKWVADLADEAATEAERLWYKCISDVPGRRKDDAWVDQVVRTCQRSLTLALDVHTAATWIRFKTRLPNIFSPDDRLKAHKRLVDQIRNLPM